MAVMMPREKWSDERLDDLNRKVADGFSRVDMEIRELRGEMKELRGEMNMRFDSMQRAHYTGVVVVVAALIGLNAF